MNASSTGTPAATNAPNANSRIRNVIGTESRSAFWKSLPIVLFSSWFALAKPNSATVKPGLCFCTRATASSTGCTFLSAFSAFPAIENCTSAAWRSFEIAPPVGQKDVLHLRQRVQLRRHARDRRAERGVAHRERPVLHEHVLGGRLREAGALQDRLRARCLAGRLLGVGQLDRPGGLPDRYGGDHERDPPERGRFPVCCAPPPRAGGEILTSHRGNPPGSLSTQSAPEDQVWKSGTSRTRPGFPP